MLCYLFIVIDSYIFIYFLIVIVIVIVIVSPNEPGYRGEDGLSFRLMSKTKSFRIRAKTTAERDEWLSDISRIARYVCMYEYLLLLYYIIIYIHIIIQIRLIISYHFTYLLTYISIYSTLLC